MLLSCDSEVDVEHQILCEPCDSNGTMSGGFDPDAKQVKLFYLLLLIKQIEQMSLTGNSFSPYCDWPNLSMNHNAW